MPQLSSLRLENAANGVLMDRQELTELFPSIDLSSLAQRERDMLSTASET